MKKKLIYYISALLLTCSCSGIDDEAPIATVADISFALEIPQATMVATRATYNDNSVRNLDLLVFNASGGFVERVQVNAVSGTGMKKTFNARLTASTTARTIHIIANARGGNNEDLINFSALTPGAAMATVIPGLTSKTLSIGYSPQLPLMMWGRVYLSSVTPSTTIGAAIPMLRMVASLYVTCDTPTQANGLGNFELRSISVIRTSNAGRVVPADFGNAAATPTTPTLFSGVSNIDYVASTTTGTWAPVQSDGVTSELYLYEKANTGNTATDLKIIIRGVWNGLEGYYPVWLLDELSRPVNIVRNHRYCLSIKGVYGVGYPTLDQAKAADPIKHIGGMLDATATITDIITDGEYLLGLSTNNLTLAGSASGSLYTFNVLVMSTRPSVWPTIRTDSPTWINNFTLLQQGAGFYSLTGLCRLNASNRVGTVTVRVDNLIRTLTITQTF